MLAHCRTRADLGDEIVPGLFEVEADYLVRQEWAADGRHILWRRTKLGLHVAPAGGGQLDEWLTAPARTRWLHRYVVRRQGPKFLAVNACNLGPCLRRGDGKLLLCRVLRQPGIDLRQALLRTLMRSLIAAIAVSARRRASPAPGWLRHSLQLADHGRIRRP
jgi:hypothetical protein